MISRLLSYTTLVACLAALPGHAGDTYSDVVHLEVRPGWTQADGSHLAGLHLTLAPGWKTYWRVPGDAGIPPQFDWAGSENIAQLALSWPAPHVFDQSGYRSIGYKDDLVIPLHITPKTAGGDIRIKGEIDIGVCNDICIPQTFRFDQTVSADLYQPDPVIAAALAATPYSAAEAGVGSVTCDLRPIDGGLRISVTIAVPHAGGSEAVVVETDDPQIWVSEAKTQRSAGTLTASSDMIHTNDTAFSVDRSALRFTVVGAAHSVDIRGCTPG